MRWVDAWTGASGAGWYRLELEDATGAIVRSGAVPLEVTGPEPWIDLEVFVQRAGLVRIAYRLPRTMLDVDLAAYDAAGRRVRSLDRGAREAGTHTFLWDARGDSGHLLARGVYWIRLQAGGATRVARIVWVRP
jgi:flagellar hook assembly protein FlgD